MPGEDAGVSNQKRGTTATATAAPERLIDDRSLPQKPAGTPVTSSKEPQAPWQVMQDQNYIDNNLKSIEFYEGEVAIVHYKDGGKLQLGLVPDLIEPPIESVDYRTPSREHVGPYPDKDNPDRLGYVPRGQKAEVPSDMSIKAVVDRVGRTVSFKLERRSGRIVPTEINSLTAPRLCAILRDASARYAANVDAIVSGTIQNFESLNTIVTLASFAGGIGTLGSGPGVGATRGITHGRAYELIVQAENQLLREFAELLRSGATRSLRVEYVVFENVRVVMSGKTLTITRFMTVTLIKHERRGRLVQSAYERAAILAGREVGASSVVIRMETPVNAAWRAYLESQGYSLQLLESATGFTKYLVKAVNL